MSLIELLIAMSILLIVSLALMQTALVSINSNMRNLLRDEAVRVAETQMDDMRNMNFASMPASSNGFSNMTARNIKDDTVDDIGYQFFAVNSTVATAGNVNSKLLKTSVYWKWQTENYVHTVESIRHSDQ
jgi:type IV pilus assembly protein PilV